MPRRHSMSVDSLRSRVKLLEKYVRSCSAQAISHAATAQFIWDNLDSTRRTAETAELISKVHELESDFFTKCKCRRRRKK